MDASDLDAGRAEFDAAIAVLPLPAGLDTPVALVDLDRVEANIARVQEAIDALGVHLRPHAKTHRTPAFGRLQVDAGAVGLTVALLGEAEVFAAAGLHELFVAYPVLAVGAKATRLRRLHDEVAGLSVGVDSVAGVQALAAAVAGARRALRVLVEVDSGGGRSGVADPNAAAQVAMAARSAGLLVEGVFTHGGHSYAGPDRVAGAAADEERALAAAARAIEGQGILVPVRSAGSTPTTRLDRPTAVTEERPGTYVFGDRQQVHLGAHPADAVALTIATTVVSTAARHGHVVLDAGAKAIGKDRPGWLVGYGAIPELPGSTVHALYDHHAVVRLAAGQRAAVGDVVQLVPNHVCPVVDLQAHLVVCRSGRVVDRWAVGARGVLS